VPRHRFVRFIGQMRVGPSDLVGSHWAGQADFFADLKPQTVMLEGNLIEDSPSLIEMMDDLGRPFPEELR